MSDMLGKYLRFGPFSDLHKNLKVSFVNNFIAITGALYNTNHVETRHHTTQAVTD